MTRKNQTKWKKDRETFLRKILIASRVLLEEGGGKLELTLKVGETSYNLSPQSEIFDPSEGMKGAIRVFLVHAVGQIEVLLRFDGAWVWWDPNIKDFPASIARFREDTKDKMFILMNLDEEGNPVEGAVIRPETIPDSSLQTRTDEKNLGKMEIVKAHELGTWHNFQSKTERVSFFYAPPNILEDIENQLFIRMQREGGDL